MSSFLLEPEGLFLLISFIAYIVGSIPFGVLIAKIFHIKDITRYGSGNIGASNVSRVAGFWPAGFLTLFLDVGKGAVCVFFASPAGVRLWSPLLGGDEIQINAFTQWSTGFFVVLGHCYSPWLRFRGGKGVATAFGVFSVLCPEAAALGAVAFGLTFLNKRIASLSSLMAMWMVSVAYLALNPIGNHLWMGAALIFLVLLRHEKNIDNLLSDAEKPI